VSLIRNETILLPYPASQTNLAIPVERFARNLRSALIALVAVAGMLVADAALADEIAVRDARLIPGEDGIALNADFDVMLTPRLENALHMGVALYFTTEFECTRPRWYWLDDRITSVSRSTRVSFHALTRTYRLSTGTLHQSFPTLDDALHVVGRVRHWIVLGKDQLSPETAYLAAVRIRLDVSQLPKPFQVSALANREWTLASEWARWEFTAPAGDAGAGAK
jgi:Domain of unknown function (DUF4390)